MSKTYVELQQRRSNFATRLRALVAEFPDIIGPQIDPITEQPCEHERDEVCDCKLPDHAMLNHFVLLTTWSDLSESVGDGEWSHYEAAPGMTKSHIKGLLFTHLHS